MIVRDLHDKKRYLRTSYAPIFSDEKLLQGIFFMAEDITDEKGKDALLVKQNLLLKEQEEQLLQAQKIAKIGNWSLDIKTMKAYWSDEIRDIFAIESNIEVGPEFLSTIVVKEDWPKLESSLLRAVKDGKCHHMEYRIKRTDGTIRWVDCRGIRIEDKNGSPIKVVGTLQDITEKKEEELKLHQYKHIVSATTDLIVMIDKNYTFITVNDAYLKYHHKTREEVIGFSVETLIGQENFYAQKESLDKALKGEEFTIKNNNFYDESKNRKSEEIRFYPYKDENGNTQAVVLNIRDITEANKIEAKLKEQEEMMIIQSRQAAMGEMISMIAHQWRQPLSVIAMAVNNVLVDIDLGEFKEEELINHSHTILNQTEYLSNTIDDFRNFFKRSKEVEEDKIAHIIESALQIIKPSLDANNIQIDVNCDPNIKLSTYKSELKQVIINILSNAKDALKTIQSNTKQIKITITEENDNVLFSFFNNGPEIKPQLIHKIFEPYFTTKESLGGSGLGLYMSKSIIVKHLHGKISAKNRDGGVEFNILIPKILEDEQN